MLRDDYVINYIAAIGDSVTRVDQLPNDDWIMLNGEFDAQSDIRLSWDKDDANNALSAFGRYWLKGEGNTFNSGQLIVQGFIENAQGSNTEDFIQGNEGNNILYGDATNDGDGGDDIVWGAAGNDTIFGGTGQDGLSGDDGDDVLFGDAGEDEISGNGGIDFIEGGTGRDALYGGGDSGDVVSYSASEAGVKVRITFGSATTGIGGDAAGDLIKGFTNVLGSAHDDVMIDTVNGTIAFGYNDNTFFGGDGDDILRLGGGDDKGVGGDGDDDFEGGAGADNLYGGSGIDLIEGQGGRDLLVGGAGNNTLIGGGGADKLVGGNDDDRMLGGSGGDVMIGRNGNDLMRGDSGGDEISGGGGDDRLTGGRGGDNISGGRGADTFIWSDAKDSQTGAKTRDSIGDFRHGQGDMLDFSGLDANGRTPGHQALTNLGHLEFDGTRGALHFVDDPNGLMIEVDLNGDQRADMQIFLQDVNLLRDGDIIL